MRTRKIEYLRPAEILEEKEKKSIVYLPLGPLEWHGPHMPYGTDPLAARKVALNAAEITGGVVMPTLFCGTERERTPELLDAKGFTDTNQYIVGMDVPKNSMKSFYTKEDTFGMIVREYLRLLVLQEYDLIVIVNGHGAVGQTETLNRLCIEFSNETKSKVISHFVLIPLEDQPEDMGHATCMETSIQMAINKDNVDIRMLPPRNIKLKSTDWGICDGQTFMLKPNEDKTVVCDPRDATAELGQRYIDYSVEKLCDLVLANE